MTNKLDPKGLEALARAYDGEDAACMGEPSPWMAADAEGDDEWKRERLSCAEVGLRAYLAATIPADVAALTVLNCAIAKRSRRMAKTSLCWCAKDRNDVWCANASGTEPDEDASSVETLCGEFIILPHGKARRAPTCHRCMDIIRGGSNG